MITITELIKLLTKRPQASEREILKALKDSHYPNIFPLNANTDELLAITDELLKDKLLKDVKEFNTLHDNKNALYLALELDYSSDVINAFLRKGADMYQAAAYAELSNNTGILERIYSTPVINIPNINYKQYFDKNKRTEGEEKALPQNLPLSPRLMELISILRETSTESYDLFFSKFQALSEDEKTQLNEYMPILQQEAESILSEQQALVNTLVIYSYHLKKTSDFITRDIKINEILRQNQINSLHFPRQVINMDQSKEKSTKTIHALARSHVYDGSLCDFSLRTYANYSNDDIKTYLVYHLQRVGDVETLYYKYKRRREVRSMLNMQHDHANLTKKKENDYKEFVEKIKKRLLFIIKKIDQLDDWKTDPILNEYTKDNIVEKYKINEALTADRLKAIEENVAKFNNKTVNNPNITGDKRKSDERSDDEDNSSGTSCTNKAVLPSFESVRNTTAKSTRKSMRISQKIKK